MEIEGLKNFENPIGQNKNLISQNENPINQQF